jgi:hypothetical protein
VLLARRGSGHGACGRAFHSGQLSISLVMLAATCAVLMLMAISAFMPMTTAKGASVPAVSPRKNQKASKAQEQLSPRLR